MSKRITDHTVEELHSEYRKDMEQATQLLIALERKYAGRGASIIRSRDDAERTPDARQAFEHAAMQYFTLEHNFSTARQVLRPDFEAQALSMMPVVVKMARKTERLKKPKIKKKHGLPVMPSCGHCVHSRQDVHGGYWCDLAVPGEDEGPLQLGPTNGCAPPKECPLRKIEE